jgi:hypothetical protein
MFVIRRVDITSVTATIRGEALGMKRTVDGGGYCSGEVKLASTHPKNQVCHVFRLRLTDSSTTPRLMTFLFDVQMAT